MARTRTAILDAASTYGQEDLDGLAAIGDPTVSFGDDDDLVGFADFGGYLGWRVGIEADGTWSFFVAGD